MDKGRAITFNSWGKTVCGTVFVENIKTIRIVDEDGMPYATCTAQIDGLAPDEFAIKNWTENEGMLDVLIANEIVEPPHRWVESGFVSVPICRLKEGVA